MSSKHVMTQEEWEEEICEKILRYLRDEIYLEFRYFGIALSAFSYQPDRQIPSMGTDGERLFYSPAQIFRVFADNSLFLNRCYLHNMLHCIFSHLWIMGNRNRELWQLACDIMVEYVIDRMDKKCVKRILSGMRVKVYGELKEREAHFSAALIYNELLGIAPEQYQALVQEFHTDTHRFWPKQQDLEASLPIAKKWEQIARQSQLEQRQRGDEPDEGENLLEQWIQSGKKRRSYREFLRKFCVFCEELHINDEEFDLGYYTFGLRQYGNMPIVEPLETRESRKICDFVIVLDTSYSTSGELVRSFLRETFDILGEQNAFFEKCRVHVLQCDDEVRSDTLVTGRVQAERFLEEFEFAGGGGTDFRPAFAYVDDLLNSGEMRDLRGMLYFTDGKGTYPAHRPDYETAFLFLGEYEDAAVPPWAMRLRLWDLEIA